MIEAKGLTKRYGKTLAVDNLSFQVQSGQVTGFLGPNGAGKSTTMRMILGLDRPTSGDVRIDGQMYRELKQPLRKVGALLDAKWVHPNRSARAHLQWMARANGLPKSRVEEVLGIVGLASVADKRAGEFSLGMSQRLGIAGALLGDPEVLLFDEPVNGLDPEGIVWIRKLMQQLAREGRTVFVSSHLLSEMALTAEHLLVIGRGHLISNCTTQQFIDQASGGGVKVRGRELEPLVTALTAAGHEPVADRGTLVVNGLTTDEIGELAARSGAVLHELSAMSGSLEEAFMRMTSGDVEFHAGAQQPVQQQHAAPAAAEVTS